MNSFLTVAQQVIILFILIGVGVLTQKTKLLSEKSVQGLTNLVLYCVTPCLIIRSFAEIPFSPQKLKELLIALLLASLIHVGMILLTFPLVRDTDPSRQRMLRFAAMFSNAGFMGLPLQEALIGADGAFFGGMYIAVFNAFVWSFGLFLMSGDRKQISPKRMLLTPGLIGVFVGLIVFLTPLLIPSFSIPEIIYAPIRHLAALNTPIPMIVVGYYLAQVDFKAALRDYKSFWVLVLRMVIFPLLTLGILYLCGLRGNLFISLIISVSTPVATMTTMFATKYDRYPEASCNLVSLTTLVSVITMPLLVGLAKMLA